MFKVLLKQLTRPLNLAILNGILIVVLISMNIYFQAFCIPSGWAIGLLSLCFITTIVYPLPQLNRYAPITGFINGLSLITFFYCIIFLGYMNLLGLLLVPAGISLVVFIPHFFVLQLFWKNMIKPHSSASRPYFLLAISICLFVVLCIGKAYQKAILSVQRFRASHYTQLDKDFMTEKILGMHFIYHTRICEFDGWRPPKHEPILVIGMWLNNRYDPLPISLGRRLELYRQFFPEKPYKFPCSCGVMYSSYYHTDPLWTSPH